MHGFVSSRPDNRQITMTVFLGMLILAVVAAVGLIVVYIVARKIG